MAKRGARAKSPGPKSFWMRGLLLASPTLALGLWMGWFAAHDREGETRPAPPSQMSDSDLAEHFRSLVRQGPPALARVVESLFAKRESLQSAAARTLHEEIERCGKTTASEAGQRLDQIARLLANNAPQSEDDALANAATLAERILAISRRAADSSDRLRNCHIVLKEEAERRMKEQARSPYSKPKSAGDGHEPKTGRAVESRSRVAVNLTPLAGGGLAVGPSDAPLRRLPKRASSDAVPLRGSATASTGKSSDSRPNFPSQVNAVSGVARVSDKASMGSPSQRDADGGPEPSNLQEASAVTAAPVTAGTRSPPMPRDMAGLLEVARRMRFGSGPPSAAHRAEFAALGVEETQLKLAQGAIDRDARVRREVVEALPACDNVDARRWLLWFSYDRDADVRRAAIALLATAGDLELKKRVREAAESDADARVRQQAQAALQVR